MRAQWDVAVVGGGPAGLAAAHAAAAAGARTVILERAEHPRYKTCGGGLIGASLNAVRDLPHLPARDEITTATFTLRGGREFTRTDTRPLLTMVMREEFDAALLDRALAAGAQIRQRATVRAIGQEPDHAYARLAGGDTVTASVIIGADGSSGVTARHVGVTFDQVDLGLELEIAIPEAKQRQWARRILLDWGRIPASYGWVFPKGDRLTVGVIAARASTSASTSSGAGKQGDATRDYLREFTDRLGLASDPVIRDSGHLTRCRSADSALRSGRVIVAGDAAGLLEPWTREGISFALRSGALAGEIAAKASMAESPQATGEALDAYPSAIEAGLGAEMRASRVLVTAFARHAGTFHRGLATPKGWRAFGKICRSELPYPELIAKPAARLALSMLNRVLSRCHDAYRGALERPASRAARRLVAGHRPGHGAADGARAAPVRPVAAARRAHGAARGRPRGRLLRRAAGLGRLPRGRVRAGEVVRR
jgi:geranylgeranyl reductase family protein